MDAYTIPDAAERFAELVSRAEAGEDVAIVRDGRVIARLTPESDSFGGTPFDWAAHRAWAEANLSYDPTSSVVEMRRQARY